MRRNVSGLSPWEAVVGYSRAVRVGNHISVAGTTATVNGEAVHPSDPAGQTRVILGIIEGALREAGASLSDVVRTRIYVTDISQWQAIGQVHGEVLNRTAPTGPVRVFGAIRPACSMVQVAALIDPAHLLEIEADAILEV
ncbi:RidA family protein [Deinococcus sp.]|uniref:RidA family protein n=1 Tax=Deinococcus sp. TaxID=47478 RepID=UPI0025F0DC47|nr:RidA family protein [Deinococcus sp.]